jgi:hypothetical protein
MASFKVSVVNLEEIIFRNGWRLFKCCNTRVPPDLESEFLLLYLPELPNLRPPSRFYYS